MLVLVDGNSLLHRVLAVAEYANRQPGVAGKYGGVSAFLTSLRRPIMDSSVQRCVVVFDGGLSERRMQMFPDYKKHRIAKKETDPEEQERRRLFYLQMRYLCTVLPMLGVTLVVVDGKEGDDVIWCARAFGVAYGHTPCVIISEDLDFGQMVDNDTHLYRPIRDQYLTVNNFDVVTGIPRDRYLLSKAIKGDPSDGIRGVSGVGEVTARKIALDAPSSDWDSLREWCERSKDRRIRLVAGDLDTVKRNFELMKLGLEKFTPEELASIGEKISADPRHDLQEAYQMIIQFGFNSIAAQFHDWALPFMRIGNG